MINRACDVDDCEKKHIAKGLCKMHYYRLKRTGRLDIETPLERFTNLYEPIPESGCWIWLGTLYGKTPYGQVKINGKKKYTHRASWELHNGAIPEGMCVLHRCDVPLCVNPDHLFLGTHADNIQDCIKKGRNRYVEKYTNEMIEPLWEKHKGNYSAIARELKVNPGSIRYACRRLGYVQITPIKENNLDF